MRRLRLATSEHAASSTTLEPDKLPSSSGSQPQSESGSDDDFSVSLKTLQLKCSRKTISRKVAAAGVCQCLGMMPDKPLIHFACRHHVLQVLVVAVLFSIFHEMSKGPDINLFFEFRNLRPQIDQAKYSTAKSDVSIMLQV